MTEILEDVIRGCNSNNNDTENTAPGTGRKGVPWRILIVDRITMRIISSVCKMHEIAYEGILLVEDIQKSRERFPFRDAIYLLSPSEESVDRLIQDFQDPSKPAYRDIHVFFTEGIVNSQVINCIIFM